MKRQNVLHNITVISLLSVSAVLADDGWIRDAATGCAVWNPNPAEHETIVWIGAIEDGKADGYGIATWRVKGKQTEQALGQWQDGRLHGHGVWRHESGAMYQGQWTEGAKNGCGIYTWPDGTAFVGEYTDDRRSHGRAFSPDGSPLKTIETARARELAYTAEDAAIAARKAASRARVENPILECKKRQPSKEREANAEMPEPQVKQQNTKPQIPDEPSGTEEDPSVK